MTDDRKRTRQLNIRVEPRTMAVLREAAARQQMSLSAFVRRACLAAAEASPAPSAAR